MNNTEEKVATAPQEISKAKPEKSPYDEAARILSTRLLPDEVNSQLISNFAADDKETADRTLERAHEVDPWTFRIHYEDYEGNPTKRTITLHEIDYRYIRAWCHARKDWRTFRIDRVAEIHLDDGVRPNPQEFFRQLGVRKAMEDGEIDPIDGMKEFLRPTLAILVALGRSDGKLTVDEIAEISAYAEKIAAKWGLSLDQEELSELRGKISRMRPSPGSIKTYLSRIMNQSHTERQLFFHAMSRVAAADGEIHEQERNLLERIRNHAERHSPQPIETHEHAPQPSTRQTNSANHAGSIASLLIPLFGLIISIVAATLVTIIAHDLFGLWGYVVGEIAVWLLTFVATASVADYGLDPVREWFGVKKEDDPTEQKISEGAP